MRLVFCSVLIVLSAWRATDAVGCDTNPCEHQCIDTIDSYYCQCWPNYALKDDQVSCESAKKPAFDALYRGCYEDKVDEPDMDFLIWTRDDATVVECVRSCSSRFFAYAGLQAGTQCWCDTTYQRRYNETDTCTTPCSGTASEICGGTGALSVYNVPISEYYMGCWFENTGDREMAHLAFSKTDRKPPMECRYECALAGFTFAALFDGGDCYCGNTYEANGLAGDDQCFVPCFDGYYASNCGGNTTNAIFRTETASDLSPFLSKEEQYGTIFFQDYLYTYPNKQGILSNRMVTYASDVINIENEDMDCAGGNCYGMCGDIATPAGYDQLMQTDMYIRAFHVNISEIKPKYIDPKSYTPTRVYLYAQTIVIDQDVDFWDESFSILMRARQIIMNYEANPSITFDHAADNELNINISQAITYGVPSDLTLQKMSLLCARMLLGTTDEKLNQLGWYMVDDIVRDRAYTEEQQNYMNYVRAIRSNFTTVGRNDVYWAPYYSKNYYTEQLQLFTTEIQHYADEYDDLLASYEQCTTFKQHAQVLIGIWVSNVLDRSQILLEDAEDAVSISEATYLLMYQEYNTSREKVPEAAEDFKQGLEDWKKEKTRKCMFHLISSCVKMAFGQFPVGSGGLRGEIEEVTGVIAALELLEVTLEDLGKTVNELDAYLLIVDEIMATRDYQRYMDNVESVAALHVMIEKWDTHKYQIDVIFREEEFRNIDGALEFSFAIMDVCIWGQSLTRSAVEYANNIREYVKYDAIHKANELMRDRFQQYFNALGETCETWGQMALAFYEQHYDMMLVGNDLLIQFCEAYFYENLEICPSDSRPVFDGDLRTLAFTIDKALARANAYSRTSKAALPITITDPIDILPNCTDSDICPVKVFSETGKFHYKMPLDERRLEGIDLFLINELRFDFIGATSTVPGQNDLRITISKEGPFMNRLGSDVYTFYTRGMHSPQGARGMTYQYDISTGTIELFCNLVGTEDGNRGSMIQQACPFTTWNVEVDPYSADYIDVSQVTAIEMTLMGFYVNFLEEAEN